MRNLFDLSNTLVEAELFELLIPDHGVLIERIVSVGHTTPQGEWYDQDRDEWVALLQGEATILYETGCAVELKAGDHVLIHAHRRHRVERTSADPPCIWIAVHGNLVSR